MCVCVNYACARLYIDLDLYIVMRARAYVCVYSVIYSSYLLIILFFFIVSKKKRLIEKRMENKKKKEKIM